MTTETTSQPAVETLESIAHNIVTAWADVYQVTEVGPGTLARLATAILSCLRNERERVRALKAENERLRSRVLELETEIDTKAGYL